MKSKLLRLLFLFLSLSIAIQAKDKSRFEGEKKNPTYDFIVVGGGIGGCVVAARLSENKNHKVLLIERGTNVDFGLQFEFEGPEGPNWEEYCRTAMETAEFYQRDNTRQTDVLRGTHFYYFHPKGLGGLSTMNDQIFTRGSQAFWDSLNEQAYSWDAMVPFFKKIENTSSIDGLNKKVRGKKGPLVIMRRTPDDGPFPPNPDDQSMIEGISQALYGKLPLDDYNAGDQIGISPSQLSTTFLSDIASVFPDKRQTVFSAYLGKLKFKEVEPNVWRSCCRKNLTIWTNKIVSEVAYKNCRDENLATGVIIKDIGLINARKEVILSAGALNTPTILQNSGIDGFLPDVGQNLHDHIFLGWSSYDDLQPYPDGVKPSSYVLFASSDGSADPDIIYHAVPTLRQRPTPTFGVPAGSDWISIFTQESHINNFAWQAEIYNTQPLTTDPNTICKATTSIEEGFPTLNLSYQPGGKVHDGAIFVTNSDLVGEIGPYNIPSDIEIYAEFKDFVKQDSGIFFRVTGGLRNAPAPAPTGFGGYQAQNLSTQQNDFGNNTTTFYSEYGDFSSAFGGFGVVFQGPIYRWGRFHPNVPEQQNFPNWNNIRIWVRNIADPTITANQTTPISVRVTVWLNGTLMYDIIDANPLTRVSVTNPLSPAFPVSCTLGKFGLQIHDSPENVVIKYRNIAYRKLTANTPVPPSAPKDNYFDWRFYTYIARHALRGNVQKTCCDSYAKPVIQGMDFDALVLDPSTNQFIVNPLIRDQVLFATKFLKISAATNNRLQFSFNERGLFTADTQILVGDEATQNQTILDQTAEALRTNKDPYTYQTITPYRIFPFGNRFGGTCQWSSGSNGVVSPDSLKVKTFKNLRICDASIIPVPFASDMQAPIMAIAERLSDRLNKSWK